ncbi:hypothetical protein FACS1894174_04040 [Bacteroidia bacterium]|nr:hypothetical protein FACS1894174_04040 [Bacteroidia bacterium]
MLGFFFKKNRREKSKLIIAGKQKVIKVSKFSFGDVIKSNIKENIEKIINIVLMIKFLV